MKYHTGFLILMIGGMRQLCGEAVKSQYCRMFGGNIMWKEITNSNGTKQPFDCSDEIIEQGVDNFKPILEKAGVIGPKNKNIILHKKIVSTRNRAILRVIAKAMNKKNRVIAKQNQYENVFHDDD